MPANLPEPAEAIQVPGPSLGCLAILAEDALVDFARVVPIELLFERLGLAEEQFQLGVFARSGLHGQGREGENATGE